MSMVAVTGRWGNIASLLVKRLLQCGYTVKTSFLRSNYPRETHDIRKLYGDTERLKLMEPNLLEKGGFDPVIDGCDGVFHIAYPSFLDRKNPWAQIYDPLGEALEVLRSISKTASVKKVVLMSTSVDLASARQCSWGPTDQKLSMIEDRAWYFTEEHVDLVSLVSDEVIGPLLQPTLTTSCANILNLIDGTNKTIPNARYGFVNVKDVIDAHILAYEAPPLAKRGIILENTYNMVERIAHASEVVNILRELYPKLKLPERCLDDKPCAPLYPWIADWKSPEDGLGVKFTPLEESIKQTVETLIEHKFFKHSADAI